jgi:wyosine [tRNA(Phe)-imidazoG37] synthetase (radical SAM superfamily)
MQIERQAFYDPDEIVKIVSDKVTKVLEQGEEIDYLTFVPDGEPTLDVNLGDEISGLRELGIPIAVISNASLIWREEVRADLNSADWVSLKVDAVREPTWRKINRPHGGLNIEKISEGMQVFVDKFEGDLATETMLVKGLNDNEADLQELSTFLGEIQPDVAYLSIPTRPPAEKSVKPANEESINLAYHLIKDVVSRAELLLGYEGNAFSFTGDVEEDLMSITAVHPMREDAVKHILAEAGSSWGIIDDLIRQEKMVEILHDGKRFYLRRIGR